MNNLKQNPEGIDIEINRIQEKLYNKLNYSDFDGYGRAYQIESKPKFFVKDGDYKDLLLNDKITGHFFFVEDPITKLESIYQTNVSIIFFLNIKKIKPSITTRGDEEIRVEILKVLEKSRTFYLEEITKGVEALDGFDHELLDMQPYHFLKFTGSLHYGIGINNY